MPGQGWLQGPARYLAATGCVGLSLLARIILQPMFGDSMVYTTFYPSVVLAAYFAGAGPAIFSAVLSGALGYLMFAAPALALKISPQAVTSLCFFTLTSTVDIYFITGMTRAMNELRMERTRAEILAEGHANLFREFNERATNHLQVVAALLQLQARDEPGRDYSSALSEASKRTMLISQVHRSLHGEPQRRTDFAAFARQLLASCLDAAGGSPLAIEVESAAISLPPDQATSLAMVLFEWFRTVLGRRHALRVDGVKVALLDEGEAYRLRLSVRSKEPAAHIAGGAIEEGLGRRVGAASEQLKGAFNTIIGPDGPAYELVFPRDGRALAIAPALAHDVEPTSSAVH